ncbi:MAG: hypothetical protein WAM81_02470 [Acidimicrobiia bacterium]
MTDRRARSLLTGIGLVILALIALIMYERSVEPIEVVGTLLFLPVFLGLMFWGLPGGVILGLAAAVGYAVLRYPAIDAIGAGRFIGLVLGRGAGYLAFGGVGGWAASQLRASMEKLDLYDQIDDATGMLNIRAILQAIDMEQSRSKRYRTMFSVSLVEMPGAAFESVKRRRRATVLKELGRNLSDGIRAADRAGHGIESDRHLLIIALPETGREGASVFSATLVRKLEEWMTNHGFRPVELASSSVTFPEEDLEQLKTRLRAIGS